MSSVELLPIILIIAVILGLRARRTMTVQPVRAVMLIGRMVILALLAAVVALNSTPNWMLYASALAGLGAAWLASQYSLRLTRFEKTQEALAYRTNPYVGAAVIALTVVRLILDTNSGLALKVSSPGSGPARLSQGPLTMLVYFLFLGYWFFYYWGILRRAKALLEGFRPAS